MNGIILMMSIIVRCNCHNPDARRYNHDTSFWAVFIGIVIAFLDIVKVMQMVGDNGSIDICEIFIIMLSILAVCQHYCEENNPEYPIISVFNVAIATGIIETLRDIFTAGFFAKDGNGCPFA